MIRGLLMIAAFGIWVYCVFDVIRSTAVRVHHLHKLVWLALVLLVPLVGAPAWLFLGRPQPLGSRLFEAPRPRRRAPDDSPEFLASLDEEIRRRRRAEQLRSGSYDPTEIDEEIRRLEEELRRRAEEEHGEETPS